MKKFLGKKDKVVDEIVKKFTLHPLFTTGKNVTHSGLTKRAYFLEYYLGNHYIEMQGDAIAKEKQDERHWSKINLIKTNTDIAVSRLVKDHPRVTARPAGTNTNDIYSARVAGQLAEHAFSSHEHNLISKMYDVTLNSYRFGTGYWHVRWNPHKYAYVDQDKLKEPGKDATDKEKEQYKKKKKKRDNEKVNSKYGKSSQKCGDWETIVLDDFQCFPDPSATDYDNLNWLIYSYMADIDELKELYPAVAKDIEEAAKDDIEGNRYQYGSNFYQLDAERTKNRASVLEYWERASFKNPKGRKVVIINQKVFANKKTKDGPDSEENPYWKFGPVYSMPFIPFFWNKRPEVFHGQSGIENQISIQKDINYLVSLVMENAEENAVTQYGIPSGSGIETDAIDNRSKFFEYNTMGGGGLMKAGGDPLPSYIMQHLEYLVGSMQDIAGIHEVSQGQVPTRGSQIPASGLRMIMDSEATRYAPNMRKMRDSLKIFMEILIRMIRDNYLEERFLSILGKDNEYELQSFQKSDLDGSFDIILETATVMDSSPMAREEKGMNLWKENVLQAAHGDDMQAAAIEVLKLSEYGDMGAIQSDRKAQEKKAYWFLEESKKGEQPTIYDAYNPMIFMETLKTFILSAEFDKLSKDKQKKIDQQYQLLKRNLAEKQGQQQGPPPQPGGQAPINGAPMDANLAQAEAMGMGGQLGGMAGGVPMPPPVQGPPPGMEGQVV